MRGFEDVTFTWAGAEYTVPAKRQLMLVAELEDALRSGNKSALQVLMQPGGPGMARLSYAASHAVRFAGGHLTAEDVYLRIQGDLAKGEGDALAEAQGIILGLIAVISPPMGAAINGGDDTEKKTQAAG